MCLAEASIGSKVRAIIIILGSRACLLCVAAKRIAREKRKKQKLTVARNFFLSFRSAQKGKLMKSGNEVDAATWARVTY